MEEIPQKTNRKGLKITAVEPGSFFDMIDLQPGDIVYSINGADIRRPSLLTNMFSIIRELPDPALRMAWAAESIASSVWQLKDSDSGVLYQIDRLKRNVHSGRPIPISLSRNGVLRTINVELQ